MTSDESLIRVMLFAILIVCIYYPYRWYENSQHHEGVIFEKCWLAREVRSADDGGNTVYLDGEKYSYVSTIRHGTGRFSSSRGDENNADEWVYQGNDGDAISRYMWDASDIQVKEKLGIKFLGIKFYLPCNNSLNVAADNW